jgi:hypothetical protein
MRRFGVRVFVCWIENIALDILVAKALEENPAFLGTHNGWVMASNLEARLVG